MKTYRLLWLGLAGLALVMAPLLILNARLSWHWFDHAYYTSAETQAIMDQQIAYHVGSDFAHVQSKTVAYEGNRIWQGDYSITLVHTTVVSEAYTMTFEELSAAQESWDRRDKTRRLFGGSGMTTPRPGMDDMYTPAVTYSTTSHQTYSWRYYERTGVIEWMP